MDEMFIRPIQLMQIGEQQDTGIKAIGKEGVSLFKDIFQSAIEDVVTTDTQLNQAEYLLTTGQLDNPVQVGISAYKAELSLSLLIQLRNRALEAYNELKNMNV